MNINDPFTVKSHQHKLLCDKYNIMFDQTINDVSTLPRRLIYFYESMNSLPTFDYTAELFVDLALLRYFHSELNTRDLTGHTHSIAF